MKRLMLWVLMSAMAGAAFAGEAALASGPARRGAPEVAPLASIFSSRLASALALASTVPGSTSYALPQLAFGGGWYTALYFANPTGAAGTVTVTFKDGNGNPLSVPLIGMTPASSQTFPLNPNGAVLLEAPNSGGLQQGWVEATLPTGFTGYAIFRQSVSGLPDQEAVVPLSPEGKQAANLIWDDTGLDTAVAVVNPSGSATSVAVTVFAADGSLIGTGTINLGAFGKTALVLHDLPGLDGMRLKRGLAQFSVTSGAVSVLGLRFRSTAFSSISVDYP